MARRPTKPKLTFSNVDKVYFPKSKTTKGEIIKYYLEIAPYLLPHFRDRPVTLIRFPEGVQGEKFYEKNAPGHAPDWIETTKVPRSEGGVINYIVINNAETLAWVANLAAIELHPFLHRAANVSRPTHLAFDLDPGEGADLLTCIDVGFRVREVLSSLGLEAFPKVSGSKGLQLYVPLNTPVTYDVATPFAKAIAELLHGQYPDLIVSDMAKTLRVDKVLIDWSQNHEKKTTVGPYSVRAKRDEPFVSTPVTWDELTRAAKKGSADGLFFTPADTLKRARKLGDLFAPVLTLKQKLPREFVGLAKTTTPARAPHSLQRYAEKRDFTKTREPAPALPKSSAQGSRRRFVIQKHAASHLHYDFRLEMDGVLRSWAIPKGLSTEVGVKRSAFQVEDHPLEYFSFEGTIPAGQYGGGTVMVWDIGTYEIIGGNYWGGDLKLWLSGRKLKGEWHIFRIKSEEQKPVWLIQKAKEPAKPLTAKQENTSVLTRRTMEQIAAANDAVWQSKEAAGKNSGPARQPEAGRKPKTARRSAAPKFVAPMSAKTVAQLPTSDAWLYEIKWDGARVLAVKHDDKVRLLSPKHKDVTEDYPSVVDAVRKIHATTALLDGEIVALDARGRPSPPKPHRRATDARSLVFYAYDLLNLEGENWRTHPLQERKERLAALVEDSGVPFSASLEGGPKEIIAGVKQLGLRGVVAKRKDSRYLPGKRSSAWVTLRRS